MGQRRRKKRENEATKEREALQSVVEAQIGDTLEAFGLKGAKAEVNNDKGVIQNILGRSRKRYVMRFKVSVIDDNGDLGEREKTITLTPLNLRIPGSGFPATEEDFRTGGKMRRTIDASIAKAKKILAVKCPVCNEDCIIRSAKGG